MRNGAGQRLAAKTAAKIWAGAPSGGVFFLLLSTALTAGVMGVANAQAPGSNARVAAPAAAGATYNFSIAPQPLAGAVAAFTRVTGLDVVGDGGIGRGIQSPGVSGNLTPQQALTRLLAGTGLSYRFTNASTVAIQRPNADGSVGTLPAGAIPLDTIDVQGETAWGPVDGYVASRSATGTKTDTPLIEVPQAISVITRDQIDTRKSNSINEALHYAPGLFAEAQGPQTDITFFMRGFQGNRYSGSIYLNGLRAIGIPIIETYGIDRIEVMRGPSSVLYGQGQPAGIVNMVTKRPTEQTIREVQLQGGSFGHLQGAFDFSGPANEDKTVLYRLTGVLRDSKNQIDFSRDDRAFISGAVTWRPTDATNITLFSQYQKDRYTWNWGIPAPGSAFPNPNGRIPNTRFVGEPGYMGSTFERTLVGYNLEHQFTDNFKFRQNFQYAKERDTANDIYSGGLQADLRTLNRYYSPSDQFYDTIAIDNQAEVKARTGPLSHTFLLGADYRRAKWDYSSAWGIAPTIDIFNPVYGQPLNPPPLERSPLQTTRQAGLYLQDQIKLENWILTLGGRYDWVDLTMTDRSAGTETTEKDGAFTKRVGLGYEFDIGLVPYVSYSESFVPVSGAAFDGSAFKPEAGKQYEVGIKFQPKGSNMRFTAAVYDLRRQNVLTPDPDPSHPGKSIQTGEVSSRGIELEAVASLTNNLNLTAAYTYNDARVTKSNDADLGKRPARTPQHVASLWADYTIREGALNGLGFGAGVRYVGASAGDFTNTFEAPAYTLVDAMVRYEIDNWRFSVNATNLFDKYYVASCFALSQCNIGRARTVLGTVSYRW